MGIAGQPGLTSRFLLKFDPTVLMEAQSRNMLKLHHQRMEFPQFNSLLLNTKLQALNRYPRFELKKKMARKKRSNYNDSENPL
jgi:hypothetical protein